MANDFTDHACVVSLCRNLKGRDPEKLPGQGQVGCWVGRKEGFFEEVTLAREREDHVQRS